MFTKLFHLRKKYHVLKLAINLRTGEDLGIGVRYSWKHTFGVVKSVLPDSKAAKFGLKVGDRIFMVDGECVTTENKPRLRHLLATKRSFLLIVLRKRGTYQSFGKPEPPPRPVRSTTSASAKKRALESIFGQIGPNQAPAKETFCVRDFNASNFVPTPASKLAHTTPEGDIDAKSCWSVLSSCDSMMDNFDQPPFDMQLPMKTFPNNNHKHQTQVHSTPMHARKQHHSSGFMKKDCYESTLKCACSEMSKSFSENKENFRVVPINTDFWEKGPMVNPSCVGGGKCQHVYASKPDNTVKRSHHHYNQQHRRPLQEINL